MRSWRIVVLLLALLLPGVMLAPVWRLRGLGAGEDDILYYFPMRSFFGDTIRSGQWPVLNPWVGLGRPYLADPQTAVWYPFTWLFAALPPLVAYPLSLWLHYSLALWGMYRLLRAMSLDATAAFFGGVAFAFCGFLLAHRAHFAMQHAAAWTPWVIWRVSRYVQAPPAAGRSRLAPAALACSVQAFAGHVQVALLTVAATLVYLLARPLVEVLRRRRTPSHAGLPRLLGRWALLGASGVGLFAVQWLPTSEYLEVCTRGDRTYADFVENSWAPVSTLGLVMPMLLGQRTPNFFPQEYWGPSHQVEQFAYAGIGPLLLALLALRRGWSSDARRRPWVVLGAFGLLLALGRYGPLCPLLYALPGGNLFRCPARAMLLFNLAVAALAAVTLHDLRNAPARQRVQLRAAGSAWARRAALLFAALVVLPLVWLALPFQPRQLAEAGRAALRISNPALWVPVVMVALALVLLTDNLQRRRRPMLAWLLTLATALDLGVIGWTLDVPPGAPRAAELIAPPPPTDWLDEVRASPHRLWVVTARQNGKPGEYSDPVGKIVANTNILRGVATLTDYGPLQPRSVVRQFAFKPWGETDSAAQLLEDTTWMRAFNVGWVLLTSPDAPAPADCELVRETPGGYRLYRHPGACGWALFADASQPGAVRSETPTTTGLRVELDTWPSAAAAAAPLRVLISQLAVPGWSASVNGQPASFQPSAEGLLAVDVPAGTPATIECRYRVPGLLLGATLSGVTAGLLVLATWQTRPGRARRSR